MNVIVGRTDGAQNAVNSGNAVWVESKLKRSTKKPRRLVEVNALYNNIHTQISAFKHLLKSYRNHRKETHGNKNAEYQEIVKRRKQLTDLLNIGNSKTVQEKTIELNKLKREWNEYKNSEKGRIWTKNVTS